MVVYVVFRYCMLFCDGVWPPGPPATLGTLVWEPRWQLSGETSGCHNIPGHPARAEAAGPGSGAGLGVREKHPLLPWSGGECCGQHEARVVWG